MECNIMLTTFQWICFFAIILIALGGGLLPLLKLNKTDKNVEFPNGEAFSAGVFLALALTMMLPSALHLYQKAFPKFDYPLGSVITIISFLILLSVEHYTMHLKTCRNEHCHQSGNSPILPVIMTLMIAIPSFFLGAALGVSSTSAAIFIFIAIMAHKGTAGFALGLKLGKSSLSRNAALLIFICFVASTPLGILVGGELREILSGHSMIVVKATILSLAAGVFLYISTLHELCSTPLISICCNRKGFVLLITGFVLTALIRLLLGEAHKLG
jgi:solute carrier family 39 (zinc transporter), member 1/2/3